LIGIHGIRFRRTGQPRREVQETGGGRIDGRAERFVKLRVTRSGGRATGS
jgi:hypothetical protein